MKNINIPVNNQSIKGTLLFPSHLKTKSPAVLLIHGWASNEKSHIPRAKAITKLGYICLTFNLRGHGESYGKLNEFSRNDHLEDIIAAYNFLTNQEIVDRNQIHVCGSSYGGYLAALFSTKRNVKTLVLRGPSLYKDENFNTPTAEIIKNNPQVFKQNNLTPVNNYALNGLSVFKGRVLIVESGKDDVVPKKTIQNYLNATNPKQITHVIIKDADHVLSQEKWQKAYIEILTEWFKEQRK